MYMMIRRTHWSNDVAGVGSTSEFLSKTESECLEFSEEELVGINNTLPLIFWVRYILYQENKSAILLENSGQWSSSKRT